MKLITRQTSTSLGLCLIFLGGVFHHTGVKSSIPLSRVVHDLNHLFVMETFMAEVLRRTSRRVLEDENFLIPLRLVVVAVDAGVPLVDETRPLRLSENPVRVGVVVRRSEVLVLLVVK